MAPVDLTQISIQELESSSLLWISYLAIFYVSGLETPPEPLVSRFTAPVLCELRFEL